MKTERPYWAKFLVRLVTVLVVIFIFGAVVGLGEEYPVTMIVVVLAIFAVVYKMNKEK